MSRRLTLLIIIVAALAIPTLALAAERFPPPEFSFNYQFPDVTVPRPRAPIFEWVDVAVLLATLGLATWLAVYRRARRELLILTVFSLLYFGFYRAGCVCPIGAIQNVTLAIASPDYVLPVTVGLFLVLPLLFALLFGRVFCAAVCPLGAIQEVVVLHPVRVPMWLERGLGMIPFAYLGVAVLFAWADGAFLICRYDPYVAFFRLGGLLHMLIAGGVLLLIGVFIGRPYCRYLCPLGAILRLLAPLSARHATLAEHECVNCHLCADACPYNAILPPTTVDRSRPPTTGRRTLVAIIAIIPLMLGLGAWLGREASGYLASFDPKVALAARVYIEQQGLAEGTTDESEAFYAQGEPAGGLYREAAEIRRRFAVGSAVLGGFLGLIIGARLVAVSLRRTRTTYEIDPAACVACGRCYSSCPILAARAAGRTVEPAESVP